MANKTKQIKDMDEGVWLRAIIAMTKKRADDTNMSMAKWMKTAILAQLRRENG